MREVSVLKEKQVLLPLSLLNDIFDLLESWDEISSCPENLKAVYEKSLSLLSEKLVKIKIRDSYSNIVLANDDDSREKARIDYMKRKHFYHQYVSTRA